MIQGLKNPIAQPALKHRNFSTWFRLYFFFAKLIPGHRRKIRSGLEPRRMMIAGCEFDLHPANNTTEFKMYRSGRPPEWRSIAALRSLTAGKTCLFLDVGANVGVYSVLLGSQMGPGSKIIAFEPNPEVAARLRGNVCANKLQSKVSIENVALGATDTTATMSVSQRNQGASSLAICHGGETRDLDVPVRMLSNYLADDSDDYEVCVLKADVEGYEDEALATLLKAQTAALPDYILMEISHVDHWKRDLLSELKHLGYAAIDELDDNLLLQMRK